MGCNTHFADREDTRYSHCLGLEDNTHIGSKLDTYIYSSRDNGDDNLSKILTVGSTNNPEVKNVEADSVLNVRRLIKLRWDRIGFMEGSSGYGSVYGSRVSRGHTIMCLGTNIQSPVDMMRDSTTSDEPPDFPTKTLWTPIKHADQIDTW